MVPSLAKPSWTPPDWLFPIAWTVLYFMIAIAGWLAWQREGVGAAVVIWADRDWCSTRRGRTSCSAVTRSGWRSQRRRAVAVDRRLHLGRMERDGNASYLFMPYLVWVSFATALNAAVWKMNPTATP